MPKNVIGKAPFPVRTVESDDPLTLPQLRAALGAGKRVTLCLRSAEGHPERGGYYFHLADVGGELALFDFEGEEVATLSPAEAVRFINHASGRRFDAEMLAFCRSTINLRRDQTGDD